MNKLYTKTAKNNFIIWLISLLCLPISKLLAKLKITPNFITFFSIFLTIFSAYYLINNNFFLFSIFFFIAQLLDFCDGQVARILKKVNNTAFNFDHFSDVFKISLIFFSFGLLFNNKNSWILIFISNFLFLFYIVTHAHVSAYKNQKKIKAVRKSKEFSFFQYFKLNPILIIYKLCFPVIFSFNAHSVFLFLLVLVDINLIYFVFFYFNFIFIIRIYKYIKFLLNQKI